MKCHFRFNKRQAEEKPRLIQAEEFATSPSKKALSHPGREPFVAGGGLTAHKNIRRPVY